MRPRTHAQAWQFGKNDELPGLYPWYPTQNVLDVRVTPDNDDRGVALMEIETDALTYRVPHDRLMQMPMRPDGSTIHHGDNAPTPDRIFIGDTFGVDGKWQLKALYALPNASVNVVGVTLHNNEHHYDIDCRAERGVPIEPGRVPIYRSRAGETPSTRNTQPDRGPYEDAERPGVFYFFKVHPTGRGRWPHGIEEFMRRDTPGQYTTRPPARTYKWNLLNFTGDGLRHPWDPGYQFPSE